MEINQIAVSNVTVKYFNYEAVIQASFEVKPKDFIAIIGANGSGKTTLIKALLGLKSISEGTIFKSKDLNIGYLPQHTASDDRHFPATVEEIIGMGRLSKKRFPKRMNTDDYLEISKVLEYLDIVQLRKKRIGTLSGGQQQRVLLARALVCEPDILIMDEPTSALDQSMRDQFFRLLKTLNDELGVSIILVTHDIATAGEFVNRVIYMDQRIVFDGSFEHFCEKKNLSPFIHTHDIQLTKEERETDGVD